MSRCILNSVTLYPEQCHVVLLLSPCWGEFWSLINNDDDDNDGNDDADNPGHGARLTRISRQWN